VAPAGIRWMRVDRASGKPVFGVFPTSEDPKSSVIWEAFQPQTEQQRSYRSSLGDPYNSAQRQQALMAYQQQKLQELQQEREGAARPPAPRPQARPAPAPAQPPGLPTGNAL
jgi:penicillin-binding protein 1A